MYDSQMHTVWGAVYCKFQQAQNGASAPLFQNMFLEKFSQKILGKKHTQFLKAFNKCSLEIKTTVIIYHGKCFVAFWKQR